VTRRIFRSRQAITGYRLTRAFRANANSFAHALGSTLSIASAFDVPPLVHAHCACRVMRRGLKSSKLQAISDARNGRFRSGFRARYVRHLVPLEQARSAPASKETNPVQRKGRTLSLTSDLARVPRIPAYPGGRQ
jgi:hypothetical protein